jgi:hypothetical protein
MVGWVAVVADPHLVEGRHSMDALAEAHYELRTKNALLTHRGEAFQELVSSILEALYPGDFQRTRPWGSTGDRKNDGFIRSSGTLLQVYAPNEMRASEAIRKIEEDFREAHAYWQPHMKRWVFVHNSREGLGPEVLKTLLDLAEMHPAIPVEHWGPPELQGMARQLSEAALVDLFGHAPSRSALARLGVPDLQPLLAQVARLGPVDDEAIRPVPPHKLEWNLLSPAVSTLLTAGMHRSDLVARYFRMKALTDPQARDGVASAFQAKYQSLREEGRAPDDIFGGLSVFVGGEARGTPAHEAAVLAVLAHFFEACDIFERPPEVDGS